MPVGRHNHSDPEPNPGRPCRPVREDRERIGRVPEFEAVMLRRPRRVHAALLGDAQHVERVLPYVARGVRGVAADHVDGDGELHGQTSHATDGTTIRHGLQRRDCDFADRNPIEPWRNPEEAELKALEQTDRCNQGRLPESIEDISPTELEAAYPRRWEASTLAVRLERNGLGKSGRFSAACAPACWRIREPRSQASPSSS